MADKVVSFTGSCCCDCTRIDPEDVEMHCRQRGGIATICGWSEYGDQASSPPKKYRTQTYKEDIHFCNGLEARICSGAAGSVGRNWDVVEGATSVYSATDCGKTITGSRTYGSGAGEGCAEYGGARPFTDGGHRADFDMSLAPATLTGLVLGTHTATVLQYGTSGVCYTAGVGNWGIVTSGYRRWELSDEDTEDDAIERLLAPQPWPPPDEGWGDAIGPDTCPAEVCCRAEYYDRSPGFSFAYKEVQIRVSGVLPPDAPPGSWGKALVSIAKRRAGTDDEWEFAGTGCSFEQAVEEDPVGAPGKFTARVGFQVIPRRGWEYYAYNPRMCWSVEEPSCAGFSVIL